MFFAPSAAQLLSLGLHDLGPPCVNKPIGHCTPNRRLPQCIPLESASQCLKPAQVTDHWISQNEWALRLTGSFWVRVRRAVLSVFSLGWLAKEGVQSLARTHDGGQAFGLSPLAARKMPDLLWFEDSFTEAAELVKGNACEALFQSDPCACHVGKCWVGGVPTGARPEPFRACLPFMGPPETLSCS